MIGVGQEMSQSGTLILVRANSSTSQEDIADAK